MFLPTFCLILALFAIVGFPDGQIPLLGVSSHLVAIVF